MGTAAQISPTFMVAADMLAGLAPALADALPGTGECVVVCWREPRLGEGDSRSARCDAALLAARAALAGNETLNRRRAEAGLPVLEADLALHFGPVVYGNVGSGRRLDFTVIGRAVNEVSRIVALCRSVDRSILLSSDFVAATPEPERSRLVSVGRFALRGVSRAQDLYTIDPELVRE